MSVQDDLLPEHSKKIMRAMKATRAVKRITFNPSEANPGETLYVHVPKLNENEVLAPNSLALIFDIDLSGGHAKQLPCPERLASTRGQTCCEVCRHDFGRNLRP